MDIVFCFPLAVVRRWRVLFGWLVPSLNLKLLPSLASEVPRRAACYGLKPGSFVGILVRNDSIRPDRELRAVPATGKLKRTSLGCHLRVSFFRMARIRARAQKLSVNAYLESLIASQVRAPAGPLLILPASNKIIQS